MTTNLGDARVLLVDDHDDLAENLIEIIESEGGHVRRAATASSAIVAAQDPFDVALVDIRLPDATGLSLLPKLRSAGDGYGEVILITGNASLDDAIDAVRQDAYAYVLKPFDPDDLLATLSRAALQVRLRREKTSLERRTRIAEKLAAVGTLSAGLAHEIRNPLNAASLQLQLLERRLQRRAAPPEEIAKLLEPVTVVQSEIVRLSNLVTDFLAFARPAGLNRRSCDLRELVAEVVRLEGPDALSREIVLEATLPEVPVHAEVDREKIKQVLLNVVRNALEAIEFHGRIVVEVRKGEGSPPEIVVSDDGPGIDEELAGRIFEPFFSTKPTGTGLGMAISHSLVSQHGGSISLDTRPGDGTRFTITLP